MFIEIDFEKSMMADTSTKKMLINTEDVKCISVREGMKVDGLSTKVYIMDINYFKFGDLTANSIVYDDKEECDKAFYDLKDKLNHKSNHLNVECIPLSDPIIPNDTTIDAIKAAREGKLVAVGSADDLIDS